MSFISWIIVGGVLGWIASMIMKTNGRQGLVLDIVVGIVGAFLAGYFLTPFFGGVLAFSLFLAGLVAAICVTIGLPFTYRLTRLSRKQQVVWLVALLAILSLSEVIIGFAWSTLFSRTATTLRPCATHAVSTWWRVGLAGS